MSKVDQLIEKFKEFKEELNKGMASSNGQIPNMGELGGGGTPKFGTSGGQGGMYRSEKMDKNCASPAAMNMSDKEKSDMKKQMPGASPGGAQDAMMIKYDANGQWRMEKKKLKKDGSPNGSPPPPVTAAGITAGFNGAMGMGGLNIKKSAEELADGIIEKLQKANSYISQDGTNREANPKLRQSDLGPGGKVHMIRKDEGTNSEAASSKPHNKEKFKVMPMAPEKEVKHLDAKGLPYSGKDKDIKKDEECPKCHKSPCACVDKSQKGHIQGNEAKGFDENKAPGRGTLTV